ncbi:glycosyltransferase family 2 protein [Paenibacillus hamazuiensis]|uniref:glycosyltransferase family 2 protein n=1 Tax=Paenibacillus hamazuiensis TaxID=2936508 RepID=UPI00200BB73E
MAKQQKQSPYRNKPNPKVSVVIPVFNEKKTLGQVLREAYRVHRDMEVIVVANGSTDGTRELAERSGAKVISFRETLGHDVGRSIGAGEARGEIVLFLDGDMVIAAAELIPFIRAVEQGVDVALNRHSGVTDRKDVHQVVAAKHALNAMIGRLDLAGASLTAVPHALSRRALDVIGTEHLSVPPKAQMIAAIRGLRIEAVHHINVRKLNPVRRRSRFKDPVGDLIVGDHLEAIRWLTENRDLRGGKPDLGRKREIVR